MGWFFFDLFELKFILLTLAWNSKVLIVSVIAIWFRRVTHNITHYETLYRFLIFGPIKCNRVGSFDVSIAPCPGADSFQARPYYS